MEVNLTLGWEEAAHGLDMSWAGAGEELEGGCAWAAEVVGMGGRGNGQETDVGLG